MKLKNLILKNASDYKFSKVKINFDDQEILKLLKINKKTDKINKSKFSQKLNRFKKIKARSNFIFLLRNLDFSLWKFPENWQYRKEKGFFGLMERVIDLFNFDLEKINLKVFKKIISPKENFKLTKLRYQVFGSAIKFLKKYDNNFLNYFEENKKPLDFSLNLFQLKKFRDYYKNLFFLKPNQLLYYELLIGNNLANNFRKNLEELTIFADYKIIQLFLNLSLIQLSIEDLKRIKNGKIIKSQSVLENELRLSTILIGEKISKKLKIPSYNLDGILWSLSHQLKFKIHHPIVFTIFY